MLDNIIYSLWMFLPAALANTIPVFLAKIPGLREYDYPMDFNKKINSVRIFGSHKTIRGLIGGVIVAIIITQLQQNIYETNPGIRTVILLDYSEINPIIFGLLSGCGALFGDAIKSFFKRRIGVEPGKAWFPFDQVDYIIGGLLALSLYIDLSLTTYLTVMIVWFLLHPISTTVGYLLGLKDSPI